MLYFLQDLFATKSLAPRTIINYRTALHWPLEEAFDIDFSHPDFLRMAMGFYHLRLPAAPVVPQWNLSAVLRFYEGVDHHNCSAQLLLLKTLCLTVLLPWSWGIAALSCRISLAVQSLTWAPLWPCSLYPDSCSYKNQTASRTPPALPGSLVCPVATLRTFLRCSAK